MALYNSGSGADGIVILQWDCCSSCDTPTPCANGSFQRCTSFGSNICCGPGTYLVGGLDAECRICPIGTYGDGSGTACLACPVGTYETSNGSSGCDACQAGTYHTQIGQTSADVCLNCSAGTYSGTTGVGQPNACTACPAGTDKALQSELASAGAVLGGECRRCWAIGLAKP